MTKKNEQCIHEEVCRHAFEDEEHGDHCCLPEICKHFIDADGSKPGDYKPLSDLKKVAARNDKPKGRRSHAEVKLDKLAKLKVDRSKEGITNARTILRECKLTENQKAAIEKTQGVWYKNLTEAQRGQMVDIALKVRG